MSRGDDTIVLCYHAISAGWECELAVAPTELESQLAYLTRRGYRGVTFDEAVHGNRSGRRLAVTFDDAYMSVFENAFPILERLGIPGTVFVPTNFAGHEQPMRWKGIESLAEGEDAAELLPMGWDELRAAADSGWEVGSHTKSHPHLPELSDEILATELGDSREECSERLGRPCRSLAYPYGDHDERVVEATRRAGYAAACTLPSRLHAEQPLRWPRVGVYPVDSDRWRYLAKVSRPARAFRASRVWSAAVAARGRISGRSVSVAPQSHEL